MDFWREGPPYAPYRPVKVEATHAEHDDNENTIVYSKYIDGSLR